MSRVLARSVTLLRRLAAAPGAGTVEIAATAGLPAATAARLLADLRALGLADQDGVRGGWHLGPQVYALAQATAYRGIPLQRFAPAMHALARRHRCGVVLACLRGAHRITLLHLPRPGRPGGTAYTESDDVWTTAGGRLLAALQPPRPRRRLIAAAGLPGPAWPGVLTARELEAELRAIAAQGQCEMTGPLSRSLAVPVRDAGGRVLASLGVYRLPTVPAAEWAALRRALLRVARTG